MKTDTQLQNDVMAELKWQPKVDAAHIGVAAKDNVITLTGQVDSYTAKTCAESAALGVYGVRAVANDIAVEFLSSPRTDQDIAAAAVNALKWDIEVPTDQVKVIVIKGWVTLEGTVEWQYQKDAAKRCVQYLEGVKSIDNMITIIPTVKWIDVTTKIEDAFRRSADLDARRIGVTAAHGAVTLSGNVSSWSEHDEAVTAAWSAPGVTTVHDHLAVAF